MSHLLSKIEKTKLVLHVKLLKLLECERLYKSMVNCKSQANFENWANLTTLPRTFTWNNREKIN